MKLDNTESDEIVAILEQVGSDDDDNVDVLNDSDTEFFANEEIPLDSNIDGVQNNLTPNANVHTTWEDKTKARQRKKYQCKIKKISANYVR